MVLHGLDGTGKEIVEPLHSKFAILALRSVGVNFPAADKSPGVPDFSAEIAEAECKDGKPVKSTKIREYIKNGDMIEANKLLGYNYIVSGRVEKGLGNGRKIGFPTANIEYDPEKLLPQDGVYHGQVLGKDAVINIGKNPTFDAKRRTIEAHIIDFDGDLYGEMIEVSFLKKTRDDIKFASEEELKKQIEEDVRNVKEDKYGKKNFN